MKWIILLLIAWFILIIFYLNGINVSITKDLDKYNAIRKQKIEKCLQEKGVVTEIGNTFLGGGEIVCNPKN